MATRSSCSSTMVVASLVRASRMTAAFEYIIALCLRKQPVHLAVQRTCKVCCRQCILQQSTVVLSTHHQWLGF
jgi:predicted dinucleotide-binding enzyme